MTPTIRLTIAGKEYALHPDDLELGEIGAARGELTRRWTASTSLRPGGSTTSH
jgi:hypothetical protein